MKYWEIIADNLSKADWSWGCVSAIDSKGESAIYAGGELPRQAGEFFPNSPDMKISIPPFLIMFALACFGLSPTAKAQLPAPSPDGGYPGGNTAEGTNALHDVNTAVGINNTAVGANALRDNTTGQYNVAVGSRALENNLTGNFNMAIGAEALRGNNANFNLAIGFRVLYMNSTGKHLTGIGAAALRNNTTADFNTAIGADAMRENRTGEKNTATGADALAQNTIGDFNTANGSSALLSNTAGQGNTAVGASALLNNATGSTNTATGISALFANTHGSFNTAIGDAALAANTDADRNTAVGALALNDSTGFRNTAIGFDAGHNVTTASNVICIGSNVEGANLSNSCFIGNIFGQTNVSGVAVFIDEIGKLGTLTSSLRFKDEIKTMNKASEALFALTPVTFRYKKEIDALGTPQFGLVAEDVEKVNPDLVVRDQEGKPYSVRYEAVNAMLLNEFLKEHRKVENLEATVAQRHKDFEAAVAELKGQIQKVSAQLELSKSAPRTVKNNDLKVSDW